LNIDKIRTETPACLVKAHFNNAGSALMPTSVADTIKNYIDLESRLGGYEAQAAEAENIENAYCSVANLIAAEAHNIAFTENATASFALALSSIDFRHGDVILTTRNDYSSNQIQFLSLRARFGVVVIRAPDCPEGGVDVKAMGELIDRYKPRIVCVTHVPTNSGLVQDVAAIGRLCRNGAANGRTLYLVDACQSIGQMDVNVDEIGCDFLSATSRKYLRGPRGVGFLYVSDYALGQGLEPLFLDMRGADWIDADVYRPNSGAKRFENWEFAWALVLATATAAEYAMTIGIDEIRERVRFLAKQLRSGLAEIDGVNIADRGAQLCGIVTVSIDGRDPFELVSLLRKENINTSAQGRDYAVIDYDAKGLAGALRISPHYYNTEGEIERLLESLGAHLRTRS
jgi:selenocysteine lyase/cysteine desulfurase